CGPETGVEEYASYVLEQGRIRFVVTAALIPDSPIGDHVREHGDGVRDLVFAVVDADAAFAAAVARGAGACGGPVAESDADGVVRLASIWAYGETRHTFVDRSGYRGLYRPGYEAVSLPPDVVGLPVALELVDHVVGNVEKGALDRWVDFYESVLGFE